MVWGVEIGTAAGGGAFSPSDVAGLYAWYKADAGTSTTTDGVGISQWDDSSGNGRHIVQATGGAQPLYKAAIVNGKPVVRFQGTDDVLSVTGLASPGPGQANPSDLSVFVVAKPGGGNGALVSTRDGGNGWIFRSTNPTTSATLFGHIGATPNVTDSPGDVAAAWNILEIVRTGLSCVPGHNGTMAGATAISAYPGASTRLDVGAEAQTLSGAPNSQFISADIAEVIIYSTAVSTGNRDSLETHLGTKYGITVV